MVEEEPTFEVITNLSDISWDVPGSIKRGLGNAIVACSRLEHTLELIIWALLNLSYEDGKMLTSRMDMNRRQAILKELVGRYPKEGVAPLEEEFWKLLQIVIEARNKIAHGVWVTVGGIPAIASTKWEGPKNFIALEHCCPAISRTGSIG